MQVSQLFDHLFVTTQEDVLEWQKLMKTPTTWLPWGSDALRLGGRNSNRIWDLVRVGRQPLEWEDDSQTAQFCLDRNLRFHGRPQFFANANENQAKLMEFYRQTKFSLAFSNIANPTTYTHPSREYLTGRWVDALACGAVVAGIPPKAPSIDRLLWEGATLDLQSVHIQEGLQIIFEAARNWRAEQAEKNYQQALERLDWRWRFAAIADTLNESPKRLHDELQLLNQKIERCMC
ncbi:glycosyltransferase [Microcoleus sp. FACHB-1515]|uniref:glycosyltransferase n=1 Tax=Cyanophyceae TaxID=3028117 RepID=UPI001688BEE9|nr:glycosyltransferase [Microcoleus sp. FACHB-1515]